MQISYKNRKLEKSVKDAGAIIKNYGTQAKLVSKRLKELTAAPDLSDFKHIPQANCHELKHNRKGELAVDVSGNHRIVFIPEHEPLPLKEDGGLNWKQVTKIKIISIGEDYH